MVWYGRKRGKGAKEKKHGCENEEELGVIGLFGHVARILNSEEKAQLLDNRLEIQKSGMK